MSILRLLFVIAATVIFSFNTSTSHCIAEGSTPNPGFFNTNSRASSPPKPFISPPVRPKVSPHFYKDKIESFIYTKCKYQYGSKKAKEKAKYYTPIIKKVCKKEGLDPKIIAAIIWHESNYDPRCVSSAGAVGLMQVIPFRGRFKPGENPFDPETNIRVGSKIYKCYLKRFKDPHATLVAYNAGPRIVVSRGYRRSRYSCSVIKSMRSINQQASAFLPD